MRKIKFRIWDGFKIDYNPPLSMISTATINDWFNNNENIMQYTGLKDKNGKDIYEGDIIIWETVSERSRIIEFKKGSFVISSKINNSTISYDFYNENIKQDDIKIIGNIYETPDLLK